MINWWLNIIETLDSLNIVYCLCGESNLWIGKTSKLLPAKSTNDLVRNPVSNARHLLSPKLRYVLRKTVRYFTRQLSQQQFEKRCAKWSTVLERISAATNKPIIIHTVPGETGYEAVSNPHLLAANTVQTGHTAAAKNCLWQLPLELLENDQTRRGYINLEPWYEGILNGFWAEDQMFAYWVSMLAGATSYCYGAHGLWNVGDGQFLAHWGTQTFSQALALDTPRLLGLSHTQYLRRNHQLGDTFFETAGNNLITIGRKTGSRVTHFFPDSAKVSRIPEGNIWLPLEGVFAEKLPPNGQAVIFQN
jgi:hypothetical protein